MYDIKVNRDASLVQAERSQTNFGSATLFLISIISLLSLKSNPFGKGQSVKLLQFLQNRKIRQNSPVFSFVTFRLYNLYERAVYIDHRWRRNIFKCLYSLTFHKVYPVHHMIPSGARVPLGLSQGIVYENLTNLTHKEF